MMELFKQADVQEAAEKQTGTKATKEKTHT